MAKLNTKILKAIALATASGQAYYIAQADALPFMAPASDPALIEVNTGDIKDGKAAARLSVAGNAMIAPNTNTGPAPVAGAEFPIIKNAVLPASKRGAGLRGGAPKKYKFDAMEVNDSFFVASTPTYDAVKKLGSTVSSANMKYSEETGETVQKQRTKRGPKNKAVLDEAGNKVKETATVKVRKFTRKFAIRPVKAGVSYGGWIAPSDGALIGRTA